MPRHRKGTRYLTFFKTQTLGRTSEHKEVWKGPRPIDIDILFYDDHILQTSQLNIPHVSIQERDFVLKPLVDIAPDFIHPVLKKSLKVVNWM